MSNDQLKRDLHKLIDRINDVPVLRRVWKILLDAIR